MLFQEGRIKAMHKEPLKKSTLGTMWCFFSKPSLCRWLAWFSCLHLGDFQLHSSAALGHLLLAHLSAPSCLHIRQCCTSTRSFAAGAMSAHLLVCCVLPKPRNQCFPVFQSQSLFPSQVMPYFTLLGGTQPSGRPQCKLPLILSAANYNADTFPEHLILKNNPFPEAS